MVERFPNETVVGHSWTLLHHQCILSHAIQSGFSPEHQHLYRQYEYFIFNSNLLWPQCLIVVLTVQLQVASCSLQVVSVSTVLSTIDGYLTFPTTSAYPRTSLNNLFLSYPILTFYGHSVQ